MLSRRTVAISSAVVLAGAAALAIVRYRGGQAPVGPSAQFDVAAAGLPLATVISPAGDRLAFTAPAPDGRQALWIRALASSEGRMVTGTEGAESPAWSPDGRSLVFAIDGKLQAIEIGGGPSERLADVRGAYFRSAWNRDGMILFSTSGVLHQVPARGGAPSPVTRLDTEAGETLHALPSFLPDGEHFLFTAWGGRPLRPDIYVGALGSSTRTRLVSGASKAVYAPPGFLLFARGTTLMAQRFDPKRLQLIGETTAIGEHLARDAESRDAAFSVSANGTLVYQKAGPPAATGSRRWVWMDRRGTSMPIGAPHNAPFLNLSPDGKRIAFDDPTRGAMADVWVYDIERGVEARLTTHAAPDRHPVWAPDGNRLMFWSTRATTDPTPEARAVRGAAAANLRRITSTLMEVAPGGGDQAIVEAPTGIVMVPWQWSRDGRFLIGQQFSAATGPGGGDLWFMPASGPRTPKLYGATRFSEGEPALSPDGRWIAYVTNASGAFEVVVGSFPAKAGQTWQISKHGGHFPRWKADGRELYFVDTEGRLVATAVTCDVDFQVGESTPLFPAPIVAPAGAQINVPYDVTADGQRFLFSASQNVDLTTTPTPLTVITNWPQRIPEPKR